jgi:hypothetical protein
MDSHHSETLSTSYLSLWPLWLQLSRLMPKYYVYAICYSLGTCSSHQRGCAKAVWTTCGFFALWKAACRTVRLLFLYVWHMQTLHTVLGMPLVLIPASDASRKRGKWPFTLLLREHLGHSRTAAATKLNNDRLHLVSGSMYCIPPNLPRYPRNPHGYTLKCFSFLCGCTQCQKAACGSCGFCTTSLLTFRNMWSCLAFSSV